MITKDDKISVIRSKQNELRAKGLQDYYGKTDIEDVVKGVYPSDRKYNSIITALKRTTKPKYIKFASLLSYLSMTINVERDQALVLLSDEKNSEQFDFSSKMDDEKNKQVVTLYKEFQKIEKSATRLDANQAKALNKYKDVKRFIDSGAAMVVLNKLHQSGLDNNSTYKEYTDFFDSLDELKFLDESKLTKHVR